MNNELIEKKITQLEQKRCDINSLIEALHSQVLIRCCSPWYKNKGCNTLHKVSDLTYIQTHFYVAPYSVQVGDYWKEDEGQFVCPTCGYLNRLCGKKENSDAYYVNKREYITSMKCYFKKVKDVYDDR
jgi:methionyl-tRNA synthetase